MLNYISFQQPFYVFVERRSIQFSDALKLVYRSSCDPQSASIISTLSACISHLCSGIIIQNVCTCQLPCHAMYIHATECMYMPVCLDIYKLCFTPYSVSLHLFHCRIRHRNVSILLLVNQLWKIMIKRLGSHLRMSFGTSVKEPIVAVLFVPISMYMSISDPISPITTSTGVCYTYIHVHNYCCVHNYKYLFDN